MGYVRLGGVELGWVWLGWVKNSLDDDSVGGSGALKKMSISNDTYWQSSASAKYMEPAPSSAGHCGTADWTVATRATRAKNIIRVLDTIFVWLLHRKKLKKNLIKSPQISIKSDAVLPEGSCFE